MAASGIIACVHATVVGIATETVTGIAGMIHLAAIPYFRRQAVDADAVMR